MTSCPPALYFLYYENVQSGWALKIPGGHMSTQNTLAPMGPYIQIHMEHGYQILAKSIIHPAPLTMIDHVYVFQLSMLHNIPDYVNVHSTLSDTILYAPFSLQFTHNHVLII